VVSLPLRTGPGCLLWPAGGRAGRAARSGAGSPGGGRAGAGCRAGRGQDAVVHRDRRPGRRRARCRAGRVVWARRAVQAPAGPAPEATIWRAVSRVASSAWPAKPR